MYSTILDKRCQLIETSAVASLPVGMLGAEVVQRTSRTGRHIEVPAQIRQIIEHVAEEFHDDPQKLLSSLTQAMDLYKRSGLSEYEFCRVLEEAEAATKRASTFQKLAS